MKASVGYLPLRCPNCGRVRLEYWLNHNGHRIYVKCEKCGRDSTGGPDHDLIGPDPGGAL